MWTPSTIPIREGTEHRRGTTIPAADERRAAPRRPGPAGSDSPLERLKALEARVARLEVSLGVAIDVSRATLRRLGLDDDEITRLWLG